VVRVIRGRPPLAPPLQGGEICGRFEEMKVIRGRPPLAPALQGGEICGRFEEMKIIRGRPPWPPLLKGGKGKGNPSPDFDGSYDSDDFINL
jgi:hypothetical protein